MKKLAIIATLLLAPSVSFAAFNQNLKYGSSGPAVYELQEFLTSEGVYFGPITGYFYGFTLAGVKAFQQKESIEPISGYFGPLSRAKATEITAPLLQDSITEEKAVASTSPVQELPPISVVPVENTPTQTAPVVGSVHMNIPPVIDWISIDAGKLHISSRVPLNLSKTKLPDGVILGAVEFSDRPTLISILGKTDKSNHGYGVQLNGLPEELTEIQITLEDMEGNTVVRSVIVR